MKRKRIILVVVIILVIIAVGVFAFVYMGGLALLNQQGEGTYRVTIRDDYLVLTGNTVELKVFDYLADGYEVVDVSSGVGYIMNDYGSSMNVVVIINGVEEDAYATVNVGELMWLSGSGVLFGALIERV